MKPDAKSARGSSSRPSPSAHGCSRSLLQARLAGPACWVRPWAEGAEREQQPERPEPSYGAFRVRTQMRVQEGSWQQRVTLWFARLRASVRKPRNSQRQIQTKAAARAKGAGRCPAAV